MRARVVEREERAVDIEQGDPLALDVDQSRLTGLDFVCRRDLHRVSKDRQPAKEPRKTVSALRERVPVRSSLDPLGKAGRDFVPHDHRPQYAVITEEFTRAGARFL